jgi:hypothetical protein
MEMSINEMAAALENAYFVEGYKKVFAIENGPEDQRFIAIVDNGDDDITIQVVDEDGNTLFELDKLPADTTEEPIDWEAIATIVNDYIIGNGYEITEVISYADSSDVSSFDQLYKETIEDLSETAPLRKFEFCLQKLSDDGMKVMDEFQTVTEYGIDGQDAYNKVRETYPGWRVYTWGIFE